MDPFNRTYRVLMLVGITLITLLGAAVMFKSLLSTLGVI